MPPPPANKAASLNEFAVLALLGCSTLWVIVISSGFALHSFTACYATTPHLATCSARVMLDFFITLGSTPLSVLIMNETFRLFFLSNFLVLLFCASSSPTPSKAVLFFCGLAPTLGQFVTGACGSVPASLALIEIHAPNVRKGVPYPIQVWLLATLLLPMVIFTSLNASSPQFSRFGAFEWTLYLFGPLLVPLATSFAIPLSKGHKGNGMILAGLVVFSAWCAHDFVLEVAQLRDLHPSLGSLSTPALATLADGCILCLSLGILFAQWYPWNRVRLFGSALVIALAPIIGPACVCSVLASLALVEQ